jgi:hypothetical protein
MNSFALPGIFFLVWLGFIAFALTMAWRLVRGVERIAAALEKR